MESKKLKKDLYSKEVIDHLTVTKATLPRPLSLSKWQLHPKQEVGHPPKTETWTRQVLASEWLSANLAA